jgi:hypothetical protein
MIESAFTVLKLDEKKTRVQNRLLCAWCQLADDVSSCKIARQRAPPQVGWTIPICLFVATESPLSDLPLSSSGTSWNVQRQKDPVELGVINKYWFLFMRQTYLKHSLVLHVHGISRDRNEFFI